MRKIIFLVLFPCTAHLITSAKGESSKVCQGNCSQVLILKPFQGVKVQQADHTKKENTDYKNRIIN